MSGTEFGHVGSEVERVAVRLREVYDLELLAAELRDLRRLGRTLRIIDDEITEKIVPQISGLVSAEIEGVGVIQAKKGSERKAWDHAALLRMVVARGRDERRIDPDTGEVLESEVDAVVRAITACAGIRDWKVTGLRSRAIDPDEHCQVSWGPAKVVGI